MNDIPIEVRHSILQQKLALYRNTYYAHGIDAQIGRDIADDQLVKTAKTNMHKAQQAIDVLEKMLAELK